MEIQESKEIWVAWTNTDCTEGRGRQIPKAICATKATAIRLGRRGYVQGSDCPVSCEVAVKVKGRWLVPGEITPPTKEDDKSQQVLDKANAALDKAKDAGLTDEEIKMLRSIKI